jgi:hypothetical protein
MGLSESIQVNDQEYTYSTNILNQCTSGDWQVSDNSYLDMQDVTIINVGCSSDSPGINIVQTSDSNASCLIQDFVEQAANLASNLSNDAKAGLGISLSANIQDIQEHFQQNITNQCAGVQSSQDINMSGTTIIGCATNIIQTNDANDTCQINASQLVLNDVLNNMDNTATGASIGAIIAVVVIGLIVLAVVVGVSYFFYSSNKKKKASLSSGVEVPDDIASDFDKTYDSGTLDDFGALNKLGGYARIMNNPNNFYGTMKNNKSMVVFVILAIIILAILWYNLANSNNKNSKKSVGNFDYYRRKLNDNNAPAPSPVLAPSVVPTNNQPNTQYTIPKNQDTGFLDQYFRTLSN